MPLRPSLTPTNADARTRLALWAIWLIPLLWAVNNLVARYAPGVVEPYTLAALRWGLVAVLLSAHRRAELHGAAAHLRASWHQYLVLGFCGMVACGAWVYIGAKSTSATNIALIYAASPAVIALASALWLRERLSARQGLGLGLALAGVLHVIVQGEWGRLAQLQLVEGDLWMVVGVMAWAAYALLQQAWPSPLSATARLAAMSWGAMPFLLLGTAWEMAQPGSPPLGLQACLLGLVVALVPGLMAYGLYGWAQQVLGASKVAATLYLGPLYGALSAWWLLDEALGWHHLWGAALLLPGVYLASRPAAHPAARTLIPSSSPPPQRTLS